MPRRCGPPDGPQLGAEHVRMSGQPPPAADAEEAVPDRVQAQRPDRLVAARVEDPHDDGAVAEHREDLAQLISLGVLVRQRTDSDAVDCAEPVAAVAFIEWSN